jgi:hypothetical protein
LRAGGEEAFRLEQVVAGKRVVVGDEGDELATRQREAGVPGRRDPTVLDPVVRDRQTARVVPDDALRLAAGRAVVDDDDLEASGRWAQPCDRIEAATQRLGPLVRHDHQGEAHDEPDRVFV